MKERGISFNTEMVRAILAGSKTQTRRVIKPQPKKVEDIGKFGEVLNCKYGKIGDRLLVEPRFMSSCYARILLEISDVRVERLQDISRGDCMSEGCPFQNIAKETDPVQWYKEIWESIYGAGSWDTNHWVWVIEFKRIEEKA